MAQDSFIRVYSCWYPGEAEIVRARLAAEGIPAYLENANFVLTCWHYALLTGGVKLFVSRQDAADARRILSDAEDRADDGETFRTCLRCGQAVNIRWDVCWSCCKPDDGRETLISLEESAVDSVGHRLGADWSRIVPSTVMAVALFIIFAGVPPAAMPMLWVAVILACGIFRPDPDCEVDPPPAETTETIDDEGQGDPAAWSADENARRALLAAVLGCQTILPAVFTLYSVWLLLGPLRNETALTKLGRNRIRAAWAVNAIMTPLVVLTLAVIGSQVSEGVYWFFRIPSNLWQGLPMQ